jgi:hypothetical protein
MEIKKIGIILMFVFILLIVFHDVWEIHSASTSAICGDGVCQESGENKGNCPEDCNADSAEGIAVQFNSLIIVGLVSVLLLSAYWLSLRN